MRVWSRATRPRLLVCNHPENSANRQRAENRGRAARDHTGNQHFRTFVPFSSLNRKGRRWHNGVYVARHFPKVGRTLVAEVRYLSPRIQSEQVFERHHRRNHGRPGGLPLAMAFAIASGLTPQAGIYCAVVTGFLISALGGSKTQIGGPTGAFVVVVAGIVAVHGIDGLYMCTVMAGAILIVLGATGMGTAVKFIPRPVVIGFTNGIAVLIASTQIKDFFGLHLAKVPSEFWLRMKALFHAAPTFSLTATLLAAATVATMLLCRAISNRIPGAIIAMLGATVAAFLLKLPVETVGTRFGGIPSGLPHFAIPHWHASLVHGLLGPAFTVAMLGAIESLMSAVVSDRMSNDRHNPNVELIGQGIANIFSPMFGGLPATGAIARTATNIRSGAQSPVAGMIHALTLLCVLLFAAPLASYIPMAALAGILMIVSYNMGEWREIPQLLRLTKTDISVWLVTFALTVFADLTVAVEAGMILAALLFIARVAETTTVSQVTGDYVEDGRLHILQDKDIPLLRHHLPHSRAVSVRRHRQDRSGHGKNAPTAADRHYSSAQHDRHRRHRTVCAGGNRQATARHETHADLVRRPRAAGPDDSSGRIRRSGGTRKYLRQRSGSAAAGGSRVRKDRSRCSVEIM